jgi:hypothetical protein
MNVTEWALFHGNPIGATVHLIDPRSDTGEILSVTELAHAEIASLPAASQVADKARVALLGDVVRFILSTGALPPRRGQAVAEGKQFFRMHPELVAVLEAELVSDEAEHRLELVPSPPGLLRRETKSSVSS